MVIGGAVHRTLIIFGEFMGVVEVAVFELPIQGFDGHIDSPVRREVTRPVIDPQCSFVPAEYGTAHDPIPGSGQPEGDAIQGRDWGRTQVGAITRGKRGVVYVQSYTTRWSVRNWIVHFIRPRPTKRARY